LKEICSKRRNFEADYFERKIEVFGQLWQEEKQNFH
jgi:hypothetical protein